MELEVVVNKKDLIAALERNRNNLAAFRQKVITNDFENHKSVAGDWYKTALISIRFLLEEAYAGAQLDSSLDRGSLKRAYESIIRDIESENWPPKKYTMTAYHLAPAAVLKERYTTIKNGTF
ncbi:MAG: hypothetical protein ABL958_11440 [Bdellovibrionia bacterium]